MKFSLYLSFTVHFISKNISHFRPVSSIRISLPCFYLLISYLRNDAYHSLNLSNNPTRSVCGGGGGGGGLGANRVYNGRFDNSQRDVIQYE